MSGLDGILGTWANPPASMVDKLPKPTSRDNKKGNCRECGGYHGLPAVHLDYMGHAAVTRAPIETDPEWTWEPVAFDAAGSPMIVRTDRHLTLWGRLTVLGHTRICVGTCEASKPEPEKELIGDLLRNGAMRFGIGLGLWAKDEWADLGTSDGSGVPSQHSDSGATSDQGAGPAEGANGSPPGPTPAPLNVIARIGAADSDTKQAVRAYAASKGYKVTKRDLANDAAADLNAWMDRRG